MANQSGTSTSAKRSSTDSVLPEGWKGEEARLFPALSESSREKRVASILLAVMTQIPALSHSLLKPLGQRLGSNAKITAFTEVEFDSSPGCRPDGLIVVDTGRRKWMALIETKISNNKIDVEQVLKYLDAAKSNDIDAVITISNEFVTRPDHSPVKISKTFTRKVDLFHWAWADITTACDILALRKKVTDPEQHYILKQFNHFLSHKNTGAKRFEEMASPAWKAVSEAVSNAETLTKSSLEVEEVVASWIAEEADLCLHLSSRIGHEVTPKIENKFREDRNLRLKHLIDRLVTSHLLESKINVPGCVGDIHVCADVARRSLTVSLTTQADPNRKRSPARINSLLRMLKTDDERILIRAYWGRAGTTEAYLKQLREDPSILVNPQTPEPPTKFDIVMTQNISRKFSSPKGFVTALEKLVQDFYENVAANIKKLVADPPRPARVASDSEDHVFNEREQITGQEKDHEAACPRSTSEAN